MSTRVRRQRGSKSVNGAMQALKRVAGGAVVSDVAQQLAPQLQKAMRALLKPHKRTGAAESNATATASGSTITIENVGYAKYIKDYAFGRRFPNNWVIRIKKKINSAIRAELRRVS